MLYTDIEKTEIEERIESKIKDGEKKYGKDFKFIVLEILNLEKMLHPLQEQKSKSRLIPLARWNDYHDFPTVLALRQYKFRMDTNGFDEVIEHGGENGKTILIDEAKFFKWYIKNHPKNYSKQA